MFLKLFISLFLVILTSSQVCISSPRPQNKPYTAPINQGLPDPLKIKTSCKKEKVFPVPGIIKKIKHRKFNDTDVGIGVLLVLAVFFPYVAVGIKYGTSSWEFFKCILYTLLLYLPGIIYAVYKVLQIY
jgi:uncharacterized membrane protein YqaE (UPF0057 family)